MKKKWVSVQNKLQLEVKQLLIRDVMRNVGVYGHGFEVNMLNA